MPENASAPVFQPTARLDFELEMGFIIGKESALGQAVPAGKAMEHIFGLVLFNDWSARDIQKWEYVPLGPFLGKNFASSISPWIVTLEALDAFRVAGPKQEPPVLPYLKTAGKKNYDIELSVSIQPEDGEEAVVSRSNTRYLYWNMAQQLAHHTVNGCNLRVGDLMASGTISGPDPGSFGSLLELSRGGNRAIDLAPGVQRTFLEDHDTVILRGRAARGAIRIGFGQVRSRILPA
jgi:fumarylacetoacetase